MTDKELVITEAVEIKRMLAALVAKTCRDGEIVETTNNLCLALAQVSDAIRKMEARPHKGMIY